MRLALIDATPIGGGPVTRALDATAAVVPTSSITRIRVFHLLGTACGGCDACLKSGRCTRHHAEIDEAVIALAEAQMLLVGASGRLSAGDPRGRALLERLVGAFGHLQTARGVPRTNLERARHKRAALICSAPPLLGIPAMLGMLPGVAGVWRVLDMAGTAVVGCASVGPRWTGPGSRDRAGSCAARLGRLLSAGTTTGTRRVARPLPTDVPAFSETTISPALTAIAS